MMKKVREFDNILDECLERVIKGETVEVCLADYPDYAAELEPLLRTALDTREAAAIEPRPEFRDKARYQFQAALREMEPEKSRGFFSWQPRWVTVVAIVVVLLLAGSGTVVAASNSLPGEFLYPVKMATEAVQLVFTPSALGKAELYARLADKRIDEIIRMAEKGKVKQVERATERLNSHLIAMAALDIPGGEELLEAEIATFEAAPAPAPVEEAPLAAVEEESVIAAPRAAGPPEDVGPNERARLRGLLSRHAVENWNALLAAWEAAPESLRAALEQALEVAAAGYEQALRNLE